MTPRSTTKLYKILNNNLSKSLHIKPVENKIITWSEFQESFVIRNLTIGHQFINSALNAVSSNQVPKIMDDLIHLSLSKPFKQLSYDKSKDIHFNLDILKTHTKRRVIQLNLHNIDPEFQRFLDDDSGINSLADKVFRDDIVSRQDELYEQLLEYFQKLPPADIIQMLGQFTPGSDRVDSLERHTKTRALSYALKNPKFEAVQEIKWHMQMGNKSSE